MSPTSEPTREPLKPSWIMMIALVRWVREHPEDDRDPAVVVREFSEGWRV